MPLQPKLVIPPEFDRVRELAQRAIAPIRYIDDDTRAKQDFLFTGKRAVSSKDLPEPYLIYFLLFELLGFKDLGRFEKLAWSIPVDFEGKAFLIEHRKFGIGIFIQDDEDMENAKRITSLLKKGVRCARPYFKWKADEAVRASQFNVTNNGSILFKRYEYLKNLYQNADAEAERRKDEVIKKELKNGMSYSYPYYGLKKEADWLGMAAIDAFYSWTEHIFIHIAILNGSIQNGEEFSTVSSADWGVKFKRALDISDGKIKIHFDNLVVIRRKMRNFLAHGAFGKEGETLNFHSSAGAVPVLFDVTATKNRFSLLEGLEFDLLHAFSSMETFIDCLWSGSRKPAYTYIQESGLPLVMTMAKDGTYRKAMESSDSMRDFALYLAEQMDNAANMDW